MDIAYVFEFIKLFTYNNINFVISGLFFIFSLEFFPPQQCQQHPETDRGLRIASGLLKEHWYFQSTLT